MNTIEISIVFMVLFGILVFWVCIILTRKHKDETIEILKEQARGNNGVIDRVKFAELIRESILTGKWSP